MFLAKKSHLIAIKEWKKDSKKLYLAILKKLRPFILKLYVSILYKIENNNVEIHSDSLFYFYTFKSLYF